LVIDSTGEKYLIAYPGDRQVLASRLEAGAEGQRPVLRTRLPVSSFWLDGESKRIAILDAAGILHLASFAAPERELRRMPGDWAKREGRINGVAFDRVGRWFAAALGRRLTLWDLKGAVDAEPFTLGRGRITATLGAAFDPCGRWLAAEDLGGLTFWPMAQRWPYVLRVSEDQPRDVAFDPAGKWIAAACRFGGVEIWPTVDAHGTPHRRLASGIQVSTLAVSPDGRLLATGTHGKLLILSVSDSRSIEMGGFDSYVWAIAFDQTGRRIAVAARVKGQPNEVVRVLDLQTGQTKDLDLGYQSDENTVSFLWDGSILTSNFDGLYRLNLETGSSERLSAPPGLAFLGPDRRHVLILHTKNPSFPVGTASVYDLQEARGWPLATHGDQVTLMAWDPSGKKLVTGGRDGMVRVGPVSGEEPHLLIGHQGPVWGVRVDPTGRFVASTSEDGSVRIWPMPSGQPLHTLPRDALVEKLRSLTNVRIVADATAPGGYRTTLVPFRGWGGDPPTW
jgi:WD40 repeat protein